MTAYLLYGAGANGKSTLLNAFTRLMDKTASAIDLDNLVSSRWYIARLYGKLVNIFADCGIKELKNESRIKQLLGGDMLMGEYKYQKPFEFQNNAKLFFSSNTIPYVYEDTDARHRRWRLIIFKEQFFIGDKKTNPTLRDHLMDNPKERSGFLNWLFEGRKRLHGQYTFTHLKTVDERRQDWKRLSNPISSFYEERVICDMEASISKRAFYDELKQYCLDHGLVAPDIRQVGRRLAQINKSIAQGHVTVQSPEAQKSRVGSWIGIYVNGANGPVKK